MACCRQQTRYSAVEAIHRCTVFYLHLHSMRWIAFFQPNPKKLSGVLHNDTFKTTPAIGGKKPGDQRPTGVSSVWHRMVPISDGYLEVVTVFHGDRAPWERESKDQLLPFIKEIKAASLGLAWGTCPT